MNISTQGSRLLKLRKAKKLTQQQLANKVGVSKTSIVWWEQDKSIPKRESLEKLAYELDTTDSFIINGENISPKTEKMKKTEDLLKKIESLLADGKLNKADIENLDNDLFEYANFRVEKIVNAKSKADTDAQKTA